MTFLIDTGADISLIKLNKQLEYEKYDPERKCRLTGITNSEITSLGIINLQLHINETKCTHEFQLVDSQFPIDTDGIIGRDFLKRFMCIIDFETLTITININEKNLVIPIQTNPLNLLQIKIPPRTEIIQPLHLTLKEDTVILNKEITTGVFISNSIAPKNGITHVKILNTTNNEIILNKLNIETENLSQYHILNVNNKNTKQTFNEGRFNKILEKLNISCPDETTQKNLLDILKQYQEVFQLENEPLTVNNFYTQHISTTDNNPVYIKNYRLPHSHIEAVDEQINKLLKDDLIEPSVSPYNSLLLLVPKKNTEDKKKWRLVVDFRKLNGKIVNDKFPLTRLEDVLDKLGRATLDMTSYFHQIELDQESRPLTAFSNSKGHYRFKRLPFGLKISSNSFQRMLTIALAGLEAESFLYVDDIIIFGCSLYHHNQNLIKVLERISGYNLKLNPEKCCFLRPEVIYLGHLITKDGIKTDPAKNIAIENYPTPKNTDEVRRFVAFCNYYRRFIKDFANIAQCLNALLKKSCKFVWSTECQKAFEILKERLISPPVLKYPDFDQPFIVTTDASNYALGAVLSQGEIGKDQPISYASKSLQKHDLNKPVIEKELLAKS